MNEHELTTFFAGLDARLTGFREMKALFDERVAFDFNMLDFFSPGENKISQILAFFLNPNETHGQNTAFLQSFLRYFELTHAHDLLFSGAAVTVKCEHCTDKDRRLDITLFFAHKSFAIGIENKIGAADQKDQVLDYCRFLDEETGGNYVLLYLTREGVAPTKYSSGNELEKLKLINISYSDVSDLLDDFEKVCRADNVRAFIRQFRQHIKQQILGEKSMGEQTILNEYVTKNPEICEHLDGLIAARDKIRTAYYLSFWCAVTIFMQPTDIKIEETQHDGTWPYWDVTMRNQDSSKDCEIIVRIYYNLKSDEVYICTKPDQLGNNVNDFEKGVKGEERGYYRGAVLLPNPFSNESLGRIIGNETELNKMAEEAATKIKDYVDRAGKIWQEITQRAM